MTPARLLVALLASCGGEPAIQNPDDLVWAPTEAVMEGTPTETAPQAARLLTSVVSSAPSGTPSGGIGVVLDPAGRIDARTLADLNHRLVGEVESLAMFPTVVGRGGATLGVDAACLESPACLEGIRAHLGTANLLVGTVKPSGTGAMYHLDLALYGGEPAAVVRRRAWDLPAAPIEVAERSPGIVHWMVKGEELPPPSSGWKPASPASP